MAAENSRAKMLLPGYAAMGGAVPGVASKLAQRAAAGEGQAILPQMFRTRPESLSALTGERNIHSISEITRGLGLDRVDEQKLQIAIADMDPTYRPKDHSRAFQMTAKLTELLRHSYRNISSDVRIEIVTRTRSYWRNTFPVDYSKKPTVRYGVRGGSVKKAMFVIMPDGSPVPDDLSKGLVTKMQDAIAGRRAEKTRKRVLAEKKARDAAASSEKPSSSAGAASTARPPAGFSPIPKSTKGGFRKPDGQGGWIYWYPGQGITKQPHAADMASHGQAPGGAQGPQKAPGAPAAQPPGGAQKPPQAAPKAPGGAQKPGGAGDGPEPKFTPAADGMGDHDALHHHVAQREAHKAAVRKFASKDPQRAAAHAKARDEHTRAANEFIKKHSAKDPRKVQQIIDRARGKNVDVTQPYDPEEEDQSAGMPAPGASGDTAAQGPDDTDEQPDDAGAGDQEDEAPDQPAFEGASDPDQAASDGYNRAPAGVRVGADGGRETAAGSRTRAVPESKTVRAARETLGRAMNIMADISAAHDHLGGLEEARKRVLAMPRKDRRRKLLLAQIEAEAASTKYDIAQLEGAHGHAMKEVSRIQTQMKTEQIEAHPIFKMFLLVMQKLTTFAEAVSDRVEEIQRKMSPEERDRKKSAEIFAQAIKEMKGGDGPENLLGIDKNEINSLFGYDESKEKRDASARDALAQLEQKHGSVDDETDENEEAPSEADDAIGAVMQMQGEREKRESARAKDREESARFDNDIATMRGKKKAAESKAAKQAEAFAQRNKDRNPRSVMREQLGGEAEGTRAGSGARKKPASEGTKGSGVRKKKAATSSGTLASRPKRKQLAKAQYMAGTRAWSWALRAGRRAMAELRKSEEASLRFVAPIQPPRHVPFFFNELGG